MLEPLAKRTTLVQLMTRPSLPKSSTPRSRDMRNATATPWRIAIPAPSTIQAVLEGEIMFFTLPCVTVARSAVTPEIMATMLASDNGISTSSFQLYNAGDGNVTITLNNFCKLQEMGPEDEDDILACVHFLLVDVLSARRLLAGLKS